VLVNSVYKALENKSINEILNGNIPLSYFIRKSFENLPSIDYDFIEIGTSNFDTLIQTANDETKGLSVEMLKYYLDCLPNKANVKKLNLAVSNVNTHVEVFYIPEDIIVKNNLPDWFKGCNRLNGYHPLHIKYNITHLCHIEKVKVITTAELFYQNQVRKVKYLKIDTEGHDCIILKNLFFYLKFLPKNYYPNRIQFETNENSSQKDVDEIINLYISIGYVLQKRGYDTVITFTE